MKLGTLMQQVKKMIKSLKSGHHRARFHVSTLTNMAIKDLLAKTMKSPI